jgi:hypothetical protein
MVVSKTNYPVVIYNEILGVVLGLTGDDNVSWSKTTNHYVTHATAFKNVQDAYDFINVHNVPLDNTSFFRIDPDEEYSNLYYVKREKLKCVNLW